MPTRIESHIKSDKILFDFCHKAKNLYNYSNYIIRQEFIKSSKEKEQGLVEYANWIRYHELYNLVKSHETYKDLPAQTSQQVLKLLDRNWLSFFRSIKDYVKNPNKYLGKPSLPKYLDKKGYFVCIFPKQNLSYNKENKIKIPKSDYSINSKITKNKLKEIRLVPKNNKIKIEIVYEKDIKELKLNKNNVIGIDLGVNNLLAITSNQEKPLSYLVNGRPLKTINQYYNKLISKEKSVIKIVNNKNFSKKLNRITLKRKNKIDDYLHKASKWLIELCIKHDVGKIVIGKNDNWKQECNLNKKNNQNFVNIPFDNLINMIKYKAEEVGIEVLLTEESYTSKSDHLSNEEMKYSKKYLGRRIKRGLFRSSTGITLNADINGSLGMLRKINVANENYFNNLVCRGCVLQPIKLSLI
jgi:putative transposase